MITCQIQWIDSKGNPTPDNNPAVCIVTVRPWVAPSGKVIEGRSYFCCAEHRKRAESLPNWQIHDPLELENKFQLKPEFQQTPEVVHPLPY